MGYTTEFEGQFKLSMKLSPEHKAYLEKFSDTRRMAWDVDKVVQLPDPIREAVGLPVGINGCYFVGADGYAGQCEHNSPMRQYVTEYNYPPEDQPGLWCQWAPNERGDAIIWNGAEKFYDYVEWLHYIIERFLEPWGYKLNGTVEWKGEDLDDNGTITVVQNEVMVRNHEGSRDEEDF